MNELVFDFKKGHVWHTRVRLPMNSLRRYSSVISIFKGCSLTWPPLVVYRIGRVPKMSVGAK